ncbi:putative reverse transcriptase domain-containing protein, partial [Tanacetum coccineum]
MEHELWNLKVKDYNITIYTTRFNELILLCPEMVPTEKKKVEAYIRGLSENIQGEVTSSSPTTLSRIVRMAHKLMEQKHKSKMDREAEAKKQKLIKEDQPQNVIAVESITSETVWQNAISVEILDIRTMTVGEKKWQLVYTRNQFELVLSVGTGTTPETDARNETIRRKEMLRVVPTQSKMPTRLKDQMLSL